MYKENNRKNGKLCKICSKLTPFSSVSIVNFEQVIVLWAGKRETLTLHTTYMQQIQSKI